MSLKNLNNWKSKACSTITESDASSNENTSDIASEFELEEDNLQVLVEYSGSSNKENFENPVTDIENILEEVHDIEEEKHIEEISGEIAAKWKCIKSDSVSWEEDNILTDTAVSKDGIWKDAYGNFVDEEGVVTGPKKSVKITMLNSDEE